MRKFFRNASLLLAHVMALSFAGCSKDPSTDKDPAPGWIRMPIPCSLKAISRAQAQNKFRQILVALGILQSFFEAKWNFTRFSVKIVQMQKNPNRINQARIFQLFVDYGMVIEYVTVKDPAPATAFSERATPRMVTLPFSPLVPTIPVLSAAPITSLLSADAPK